jgi:glycyl-tRNA synthetase
VVGIDSAIIQSPLAWKASGHVDGFSDPMIDCLSCKSRLRADHLTAKGRCPVCGGDSFTEPREFNLMFKTQLGAIEDEASTVYLRPETAQGIFLDFKHVQTVSRLKLPFGIAQMGKAFRNEIRPRNFIFRSREFEQFEIEFFVRPGEQGEWMDFWKKERFDWYLRYGINPDKLRLRQHEPEELAHYADQAFDIEYDYPFGWQELEGIASRTDYDLKKHNDASGKDLNYFDDTANEHFIPYVVEPSGGVDRTMMTFLIDAYDEEGEGKDKRVVLRLHPRIAPIQIAVFPLQKNEELMKISLGIRDDMMRFFNVFYDISGNIGRRYRRQDEAGTPYCVTVDFDSLEDKAVTVRDRDSMDQERIPITELRDYFFERLM